MMFLVSSMENLLNSLGPSMFGSTVLFGLAIIIFFGIFMLLLGIPLQFMLLALSILGIGIGSYYGNTELRIVWTIISVILGVISGILILKFFNTSTSQ